MIQTARPRPPPVFARTRVEPAFFARIEFVRSFAVSVVRKRCQSPILRGPFRSDSWRADIDFGLKDLRELPVLEEFAELRERYERNLSPHTSVPPG
jgi:hypothetical protein